MSAALLEQPTETLGTVVSCENCPAVQRLERALEKLTLEFRCEVGYWKSRHADAVKRIEQLKEELDQSRGETRALQDKLFGRKSEKSARSDRSNDLFDPEEVSAAGKKRGAQAWPCWTRAARLFPSAGPGRIRLIAGRSAGLPALRKASRNDI